MEPPPSIKPALPQRKTFWDRLQNAGPFTVMAAGVAGVLGYGLYSFVTSKSQLQKANAMSFRVGAQTLTLAALASYGFYHLYFVEQKKESKQLSTD